MRGRTWDSGNSTARHTHVFAVGHERCPAHAAANKGHAFTPHPVDAGRARSGACALSAHRATHSRAVVITSNKQAHKNRLVIRHITRSLCRSTKGHTTRSPVALATPRNARMFSHYHEKSLVRITSSSLVAGASVTFTPPAISAPPVADRVHPASVAATEYLRQRRGAQRGANTRRNASGARVQGGCQQTPRQHRRGARAQLRAEHVHDRRRSVTVHRLRESGGRVAPARRRGGGDGGGGGGGGGWWGAPESRPTLCRQLHRP